MTTTEIIKEFETLNFEKDELKLFLIKILQISKIKHNLSVSEILLETNDFNVIPPKERKFGVLKGKIKFIDSMYMNASIRGAVEIGNQLNLKEKELDKKYKNHLNNIWKYRCELWT